MPLYQYKAFDMKGRIVKGKHQALNRAEIMNYIKENGYCLFDIKERKNSNIIGRSILPVVKTKDLAVFCRQFQAMISAGISVVKTLDILCQQEHRKKFRGVLAEMGSDVRKGSNLSSALRRHAAVFPEMLINMVNAGEASGKLDTVMDRMAVHFEKEAASQGKIKGAMVYPLLLCVVAIAVVAFLLTYVMPTFIQLFDANGIKLPATTLVLLTVSKAVQSYWHIILLSVCSLVLAVSLYAGTERGRLLIDTIKLKIPFLNDTIKKTSTCRFARTLSMVVASGIPIVKAVEAVSEVVGNRLLADCVKKAAEEMQKGSGLAASFKLSGVFPDMLISMIKVGEESGALDIMLERTADFYDREVELSVRKLLTVFEPALILFIGCIVAFIVISVAQPLFSVIKMARSL